MTSLVNIHRVYLCWSMPENVADSVPASNTEARREVGMQMNAGKELSKNGDHPWFQQYPPRQKIIITISLALA